MVVTVSVSAIGALVGALLAPLLLIALGLARGANLLRGGLSFVLVPVEFGAIVGALLAPVAAWLLMRHVPIWRAILETLTGTLIGASLGMFLMPVYHMGLAWPTMLGIVGFLGAAARLRITRQRSPHVTLKSER